MNRTLDQILRGFLEETQNGHIIFLGHWDKDGHPRFCTRVNGAQKIINVKKYLWEKETGQCLDGFRLIHECDEDRCVSPEHHYSINKIYGKTRSSK